MNSSSFSSEMETEITVDAFPLLRIYKNGHIERLRGTQVLPPGLDPKTNVNSKDVLYSPENALFARIYIPNNTAPSQKFPLLIYFHGGCFLLETASSPIYHNYLNTLVSQANIITVSVDYRRAPEHPIPAAYDDSWAAIKWAGSHFRGLGPEDWLNNHADFEKVFLAGDSCGANISHHLGMKIGNQKLEGILIKGIILIHPYFWGTEPVGGEPKDLGGRELIERLWRLAAPGTSGCDDPWMNPVMGPELAGLDCSRVIVFVAEKDLLRDRGWYYYEELKKSGWGGEMEIVESEGEKHVFHLNNPTCENAMALMERFASFITN